MNTMKSCIVPPILLTIAIQVVPTLTASAQWVVEDPAVLAQTLINTYVAQDQLKTYEKMVDRWGNPSSFKTVAGASAVIQGLSGSAGTALGDVQTQCTGQGVMTYDGNRLYHQIGNTIVSPDGTVVSRQADQYRKFEASHQTAANYLAVIKATESPRNAVVAGIKETAEANQKASTIAEVQKLQVAGAGHIAALNAIDGERSVAIGNVLVQFLENSTDQAKQEQARIEESYVDFQAASRKIGSFFTPVTSARTVRSQRYSRM